MIYSRYFLGLIFLLFMACKTEKEQLIIGKWQAVQLIECDTKVPVETDLVDLEFKQNGQYLFNSTINIKEQGSYWLKENHLYTQDKLKKNAPRKVVLIKTLNADSLVLEMNYKGREQWLTMVRDTLGADQ